MERFREDPAKMRWSRSQIVYTVLFGMMLLNYQVIQTLDRESFQLPAVVALFRIIVAIIGIWVGKLWKDKGFILIALLVVIQAVRLSVKDTSLFFTVSASENFCTGLWAIGGCYALGSILDKKQLRVFLRVFIAVWTICAVLQCLIAIYATWVDQAMPNLSGGSVWGVPHSKWGAYFPERLRVGYSSPTITGSFLNVTGILVVCAIILEPKTIVKTLYGLSCAVLIIAMGLANARSSILSFAAGVGMIVFLTVIERTREDNRIPKQRKALLWAAAIAGMALAAFVSIVIILKVPEFFNEMKEKGSLIISSARAEGEEVWKQTIQSKGFGESYLLSGRYEVWKAVIHYLTEKPLRLLFGVSVFDPMSGPNRLIGDSMAHCHNLFLQIILESGLVGFLTVVLFGLYTMMRAFRILFGKSFPLWLRFVPVMMVSILIGDLAECFVWFRSWSSPALAFMFVAFGIINAYGDRKINHQEEYLA